MSVIARIGAAQDEVAGWRRHLHAHPELAYEEVETARFVATKLRAFGVDEVHEGIGRTGVVGVVRGARPGGTVGLRADMDALPIHEATGLPWASTAPGRMHACGHDGHTAMLLAAARHLAQTRAFAGTVHLIFQPAEEGAAGARAMLEDGLFRRFDCERVFGLHNWPDLPLGSFAMREGPAMAAADRFIVEVQGVGCHGAMPHQGRDPIVAASLMVQAFQAVVARSVDPVDQAVISVTQFNAGDAFNVIPERAHLRGTVRTFVDATQALIERRMREVVAGIAQAQGVQATFRFDRGYPATVNAPAEARLGADVAIAIVGEANLAWNPPPVMGAEDFSFLLQQRPGAYIWLGQGGAAEGRVVHSPGYDFNDDAIAFGASWYVGVAERVLAR